MTYQAVSKCACAVMAVVLVAGTAWGFNPQPEPPAYPGWDWMGMGFADLVATGWDRADTTDAFGIPESIVGGGGMADFVAGMVVLFDAPDNTGSGTPDDGTYAGEFAYFDLRIGDTNWSHTLGDNAVDVKVVGGIVVGLGCWITETLLAHPDFESFLPSSPATWIATDERNDVLTGHISGEYTLRDGIVPEPASAILLLIGSLAVLRRRHRCG